MISQGKKIKSPASHPEGKGYRLHLDETQADKRAVFDTPGMKINLYQSKDKNVGATLAVARSLQSCFIVLLKHTPCRVLLPT